MGTNSFGKECSTLVPHIADLLRDFPDVEHPLGAIALCLDAFEEILQYRSAILLSFCLGKREIGQERIAEFIRGSLFNPSHPPCLGDWNTLGSELISLITSRAKKGLTIPGSIREMVEPRSVPSECSGFCVRFKEQEKCEEDGFSDVGNLLVTKVRNSIREEMGPEIEEGLAEHQFKRDMKPDSGREIPIAVFLKTGKEFRNEWAHMPGKVAKDSQLVVSFFQAIRAYATMFSWPRIPLLFRRGSGSKKKSLIFRDGISEPWDGPTPETQIGEDVLIFDPEGAAIVLSPFFHVFDCARCSGSAAKPHVFSLNKFDPLGRPLFYHRHCGNLSPQQTVSGLIEMVNGTLEKSLKDSKGKTERAETVLVPNSRREFFRHEEFCIRLRINLDPSWRNPQVSIRQIREIENCIISRCERRKPAVANPLSVEFEVGLRFMKEGTVLLDRVWEALVEIPKGGKAESEQKTLPAIPFPKIGFDICERSRPRIFGRKDELEFLERKFSKTFRDSFAQFIFLHSPDRGSGKTAIVQAFLKNLQAEETDRNPVVIEVDVQSSEIPEQQHGAITELWRKMGKYYKEEKAEMLRERAKDDPHSDAMKGISDLEKILQDSSHMKSGIGPELADDGIETLEGGRPDVSARSASFRRLVTFFPDAVSLFGGDRPKVLFFKNLQFLTDESWAVLQATILKCKNRSVFFVATMSVSQESPATRKFLPSVRKALSENFSEREIPPLADDIPGELLVHLLEDRLEGGAMEFCRQALWPKGILPGLILAFSDQLRKFPGKITHQIVMEQYNKLNIGNLKLASAPSASFSGRARDILEIALVLGESFPIRDLELATRQLISDASGEEFAGAINELIKVAGILQERGSLLVFPDKPGRERLLEGIGNRLEALNLGIGLAFWGKIQETRDRLARKEIPDDDFRRLFPIAGNHFAAAGRKKEFLDCYAAAESDPAFRDDSRGPNLLDDLPNARDAIRFFQNALEIARRLQPGSSQFDEACRFRATRRLAKYYLQVGEIKRAKDLDDQYIEPGLEVGERFFDSINLLRTLSVNYYWHGEIGSAIEQVHRALRVLEGKFGSTPADTARLEETFLKLAMQWGIWERELGNFPLADRLLEASHDIALKRDWKFLSAEAFRSRGILLRKIGRLDLAKKCLENAVRQFGRLGRRSQAYGIFKTKIDQAFLAIQRGDLPEARHMLKGAKSELENGNDAIGESRLNQLEAEIAFQEGDLNRSETIAKNSFSEKEIIGDRMGMGTAKFLAGLISLEEGRIEDAGIAMKEAEKLLALSDQTRGPSRSEILTSVLEIRSGNLADARAHLEELDSRLEGRSFRSLSEEEDTWLKRVQKLRDSAPDQQTTRGESVAPGLPNHSPPAFPDSEEWVDLQLAWIELLLKERNVEEVSKRLATLEKSVSRGRKPHQARRLEFFRIELMKIREELPKALRQLKRTLEGIKLERHFEVECLNLQSCLFCLSGDPGEALKCAEAAARKASEIGFQAGEADALEKKGEILLGMDRQAGVREIWGRAMGLLREIGNDHGAEALQRKLVSLK